MDANHESEHHRARELAVENEARLDLELDGAYAGLFEWDVITNQSQWSSGFYRLHGLKRGGTANYELWRTDFRDSCELWCSGELQQILANILK